MAESGQTRLPLIFGDFAKRSPLRCIPSAAHEAGEAGLQLNRIARRELFTGFLFGLRESGELIASNKRQCK